MSCKVEKWAASATGAGEERVIKVVGEGTCSHGGCTVSLKPTNEGVIDNPDEVALSFEADCSGIGPEVITPFQVEEKIEGDPATIVRIHTEDGIETVDVTPG